METILQQIRLWYRGYIPPYYSPDFPRFLANATKLVAYILHPVKIDHKFVINNGGALPTVDGNAILLPEWTLNPDNFDLSDLTQLKSAITGAFTGAICRASIFLRDGLHVDVHEQFSQNAYAKMYFHKNASRELIKCLSVIHEVAVTKKLENTNLSIFNTAFLHFLYTESALTAALKQNDPVLACYFWSYDNAPKPTGELAEKITLLLNKITKDTNISMLAVIACMLHELLFNQNDEQEQSESAEQEQSESAEQYEQRINAELKEHESKQKPQKQLSPDTQQESTTHKPSASTLDKEGAALKSEKIAAEIEEEFIKITTENKAAQTTYQVKEIKIAPTDRKMRNLEKDSRFNKFGQLLCQLRAKQLIKTIPRDEGRKPNERSLWRAGTDSRVFKRPIKLEKPAEIELIILIDGSGSMGYGGVAKVLGAAWGCFNSTLRAMISTAVYGHSTDEYADTDVCIVYEIVPFGTRHNIEPLMHSALNTIDRDFNVDGIAISHVAKKFSHRPSTKVLMVVSDGQPNGRHSYRSEYAYTHTRQEVEKLRKRGIAVFAMSIEQSVIENNNSIYGAAYNINATGEKLAEEMQSLIARISQGK